MDVLQCLLIDIKTVPVVQHMQQLSPGLQWLVQRKAEASTSGLEPEQYFEKRAALHAEIAKVAAIALAFFVVQDGITQLRIRVLTGADEPLLLQQLAAVLDNPRYAKPKRGTYLVAHNGKEFDFPFLGRRYLINGMPLPAVLQAQYVKPWETIWLDTLELWRFGDRRTYISMQGLGAALGIDYAPPAHPNTMVKNWYAEEQWEAISQYAAAEVGLLANIFLKINGLAPILPHNVVTVSGEGA